MPLLPEAAMETLEDHFFGAGNWGLYEWFETRSQHFPAIVNYIEEREVRNQDVMVIADQKVITVADFLIGIEKYAALIPDRSYDDLLEDMDAADVDAIIQLIFWDEVRIS